MSTTTWTSALTLPVSASRDHIHGSVSAPVALVEYGDYECPFCALAHRVVGELRSRLGGQVCFVFRHFPLTTMHPHRGGRRGSGGSGRRTAQVLGHA